MLEPKVLTEGLHIGPTVPIVHLRNALGIGLIPKLRQSNLSQTSQCRGW